MDLPARQIYICERDCQGGKFVHTNAKKELAGMRRFDQQTVQLEVELQHQNKQAACSDLARLRAMSGTGKSVDLILPYEIGGMWRFRTFRQES